MTATSLDLSAIKSDVLSAAASFRSLIGLGTSATLNAGSANGAATLDALGKLAAAQIPDISLISYLGSVASQAAMLALSGQQGDWCVRSDLSTTWVITGSDPTQIGNWTQLSYPSVPVQSVFGRTGNVVGVSTDYSAVGITNTAIGASNPSTGAFTTLSANSATLSTGTITASTPAIDITQTWNNNAVAFTGLKSNITNTQSSTASRLLDLQVGSTTKQAVRLNGSFTRPVHAWVGTDYEWTSAGGVGNGGNDYTNWLLTASTPEYWVFGVKSDGMSLGSTTELRWHNNVYINQGYDLVLRRDNAGILAQRNGANKQRFNLYGTYSDGANYRRLYFDSTTAGAFTIGVEGAGTGASGNTLTIANATSFSNGITTPTISLSGNVSSTAWTTSGVGLSHTARTLTDTSSTGTVATAYTNVLGGNTIAASNATTFTDYASLFIGSPTAGSNVTITNAFSLITQGAVRIGGDLSFSTDLFLVRDAANALAQRNATSAQALRLYKTYSGGGTNFERAVLDWQTTSDVLRIGTEAGGTGTVRNIALVGGNVGIGTTSPGAKLSVSGGDILLDNNRYLVALRNVTGQQHQIFSLDNNNDIVINRGAGYYGGSYPADIIAVIGQNDAIKFVDSTSVVNTLFSFLHNGSFGIGVTPAAKLDILDTTGAGSGSLQASALNIAQTWNTTGTPTAFKLNVTDTASNAASLLLDLQVGGSSKFNVNKLGDITSRGYFYGGNFAYFRFGSLVFFCDSQALLVSTTDGLAIGDIATRLTRDAQYVIAQRNGTSAQTFRIYNTTDAGLTNYERAKIAWESNVLRIGTENLGTGAARALELQTDGTTRASIPTTGGLVVGTAALATNATSGFLYVPTCAGTPSGTPASQTGTAPIVIDTTNNKLYFYSGGAWRDAGP